MFMLRVSKTVSRSRALSRAFGPGIAVLRTGPLGSPAMKLFPAATVANEEEEDGGEGGGGEVWCNCREAESERAVDETAVARFAYVVTVRRSSRGAATRGGERERKLAPRATKRAAARGGGIAATAAGKAGCRTGQMKLNRMASLQVLWRRGGD
jgi:hypothetical protein